MLPSHAERISPCCPTSKHYSCMLCHAQAQSRLVLIRNTWGNGPQMLHQRIREIREIREIRIRSRPRHCKCCPCDALRQPRSPVWLNILVSVPGLLVPRAKARTCSCRIPAQRVVEASCAIVSASIGGGSAQRIRRRVPAMLATARGPVLVWQHAPRCLTRRM